MTLLLLLLFSMPQDAGALVAQLGAEDIEQREAAQAKLVELGLPALAHLELAAGSKDPEVRARAEAAILEIRRLDRRRILRAELRPEIQGACPGIADLASSSLPADWGRAAELLWDLK